MKKSSVFFPRTDMADEAHSLWQGRAENKGIISGIRSRHFSFRALDITEIDILDREGEQAVKKARGKYFSLALPERFEINSEILSDCADAVAELICRCSPQKFDNVLVAALGNPDITPDALGNLTASNILVTRHLDRSRFPQFSSLALCRPGVLGTSGIESAQQIKSICALIEPQLVIVIDALSGSDAAKLCHCIQISDAGISPGSGVGNDRQEISQASLGIPVVSIGIPTVIDAGHFAGEGFEGMFVTPRNIDSLVRSGAKLIAYGINIAVHKGLSISDIDALLG